MFVTGIQFPGCVCCQTCMFDFCVWLIGDKLAWLVVENFTKREECIVFSVDKMAKRKSTLNFDDVMADINEWCEDTADMDNNDDLDVKGII